jgi:hypothetical protein
MERRRFEKEEIKRRTEFIKETTLDLRKRNY